jgi:hypothetical protein
MPAGGEPMVFLCHVHHEQKLAAEQGYEHPETPSVTTLAPACRELPLPDPSRMMAKNIPGYSSFSL